MYLCDMLDNIDITCSECPFSSYKKCEFYSENSIIDELVYLQDYVNTALKRLEKAGYKVEKI